MTQLTDRVALVAGGAGAVGEGIVGSFLDAGATVVVPSRSRDRLRALSERLHEPKGLITVHGDIGTPEGAIDVRDRALAEVGTLDCVVASVGGWWQGPKLVDVDLGTWRKVLDDDLTTHFTLARAFLPVLSGRETSAYVMIVGDAAGKPVDGASLVTVASSGVLGMFHALVREHRETPVRINALYLGPVRTRDRPDGRPEWLTAAEVGSFAAYLASDGGAMVSGSVIPLPRRPQA